MTSLDKQMKPRVGRPQDHRTDHTTRTPLTSPPHAPIHPQTLPGPTQQQNSELRISNTTSEALYTTNTRGNTFNIKTPSKSNEQKVRPIDTSTTLH